MIPIKSVSGEKIKSVSGEKISLHAHFDSFLKLLKTSAVPYIRDETGASLVSVALCSIHPRHMALSGSFPVAFSMLSCYISCSFL